MAQAAVRKQATVADEESHAPTRGKKHGFGKLLGLTLFALMCAGGAAWWLLSAAPANDGPREVKETPPVFFPLEAFVVNLVPEYGDQYLQVEITLKLVDPKTVDTIKARMPEVRNRMLLLLSSKRASDLGTIQGKNALAAAVGVEINSLIQPPPSPARPALQNADAHADASDTASAPPAPGPVREVLFTSFIIQ